MTEHNNDTELEQNGDSTQTPPAKRYVSIKPFHLLMILFLTVLASTGLTIFALTFGEEKVVEVGAPERREFEKLYKVYDKLKAEYFKDIDDTELVNGAINGMIDSLGDPYSDYMNEEEAAEFNESISSSFQGIGAEIQERNGIITVVSPIKNSPAENAGILPNDQIIEVDGKSIVGLTSSEAVLLIRGEKGTTVVLTIQRGQGTEPIEVKIVRDEIPIETVYPEMIDEQIGHIQITSFSDDTYEELLAAIDDLEKQGMKGLILDVRQNPGGLLNTAMDISNLFVKEGDTLFQTQEKGQEPKLYVASDGKKLAIPVALLIDGGSASASEILAGAVSESADIPLVGLKTFGKGTVQTADELNDGSNMKFTTARWLTPDGNWIHEKGIAPDYVVDYPSYVTLPVLDPAIELKENTLSEHVKVAEEMLAAIRLKPGKVDGLYDKETVAAVKALQISANLEQTGILTGDTTFALMERLQQKIIKEDPQLLKAKELLLLKLK